MFENYLVLPVCSSTNKQQLLEKIEKSLDRMKQRGHDKTDGYSRLLNKYLAVKFNADFVLHDVTESTIKELGSCFANISRSYRLTNLKQNKKEKKQ